MAAIGGRSSIMAALRRDIACVGRDPFVTVLLRGESGTGKERAARAIHDASPRAASPFVIVDCAALSATLAEDALFGHVRGAFTGALEDRAGPFERATGGTVLLDEVGDLPLDLQMKLLRAIQARTVQRLGGRQEIAFDVRLIAATHVDLARAVAARRFRDDLFHRLSVYGIDVPPLRRRGAADIRALAAELLQEFAARRRMPVPTIDAEVLDRLVRHGWPGNVRELQNVVERMLVASAGRGTLLVRDLPPGFGAAAAAPPRSRTRADVADALRRHEFRLGAAAAALGLSRHQLYRLVRRYGLSPAEPEAGDA